MLRKVIAAVWIVGSSASLLVLAVFLFGCCVLPFHGVLHRALPICAHAVGILSGTHDAQKGRDATPAAPARSKVSPTIAKVLAAKLAARMVQQIPKHILLSPAAHNAPALRTLRSLGALRVDDDIGLHAFLVTFLI